MTCHCHYLFIISCLLHPSPALNFDAMQLRFTAVFLFICLDIHSIVKRLLWLSSANELRWNINENCRHQSQQEVQPFCCCWQNLWLSTLNLCRSEWTKWSTEDALIKRGKQRCYSDCAGFLLLCLHAVLSGRASLKSGRTLDASTGILEPDLPFDEDFSRHDVL